MALFSFAPFRRTMLFASRRTKMFTPKKHIRTKVTHRGGTSLAPKVIEVPQDGGMFLGFLKSCAFTAAFGCTVYVGASVWQYENRKSLQLKRLTPDWMRFGPQKKFNMRRKLNMWWNSLTDGQKTCSCIMGLNAVVFFAWKYSPIKPYMIRYFCSSPASKAVCLPLLLSNFSHIKAWHIGFNMFALWTFSSGIARELGKEQFVGFYLFAAVFSALISNGLQVVRGTAGLSLGASGAIMGILGYFCMTNPEARLSIIFLPMYDFAATSAIKCIMFLDVTGIVLGWKLFDHAAHLGGATFGILYAYFGYQYIWRHRHLVIKKWKEWTE